MCIFVSILFVLYFAGLNFLILGVYSANDWKSWSGDPRKVVMTALFIISRSWLLIFLAWRAHERKGDSRFDGVKDNFSLFLLYWTVQALWVFFISLPIIFINSSTTTGTELTTLDIICIVEFGIGVVIEIMGDIQKALWVKGGRKGTFCTVGIWKLSRHPNYFGEIQQWWAAWAFSYGSGTGCGDIRWWFGILSPLFTMQILLNTAGTGVANANGKNLKRYYDQCPKEYAEYRKSTSILIPMVGYKYAPLFLKRSLFMDFETYEYKERVNVKDA